jgi:hypothetical protein
MCGLGSSVSSSWTRAFRFWMSLFLSRMSCSSDLIETSFVLDLVLQDLLLLG